MKRVYTDERFPGYEIVNHGNGVFDIYDHGQKIADFESWENPDGTVSEAFAARRARAYFDRWANMDLSGEHEEQMRALDPEEVDAADHTDILNNPPKSPTEQIDNLMAQERLEQDPKRKEQLRNQIMALMRREESLAEAVVAHLLYEE